MQGNKLKQNCIQGRLNNVDRITTQGAKEVIYGLIAVSLDIAMVLFDPNASHSFISREYVEEHKITMLSMRKPLIVNTLGGEKKANRLCPKVSLNIKGKNFEANLIVLELMDIDVILGNGWLSACKGVINCVQRAVLLTTPSGKRIEYEGTQPTPEEDENDLLEGVYSKDVYHLRASSSRVSILCSVDKLLDHLRGIDAFVNKAL